jgi:thioredoxin-like negative regulator of GroEL
VRVIAEKLAGQAAVVQVNIQENPMLASRYNIRGVPVIIRLYNGIVISQLAGAQSIESVLNWFKKQA